MKKDSLNMIDMIDRAHIKSRVITTGVVLDRATNEVARVEAVVDLRGIDERIVAPEVGSRTTHGEVVIDAMIEAARNMRIDEAIIEKTRHIPIKTFPTFKTPQFQSTTQKTQM